MKNKNQPNQIKKLLLIALIMLFILIVAYFVYAKVNHKNSVAPRDGTATSFTKNERPSSGATTSESDKSQSTNTSENATATAPLVKPYGSFVSNHAPNLDGSPAPSAMQSTCITSAGATCQISFTKGGSTIVLPSKAADASGYVFWSWDIKTLGFTTGSWNITATSKSGDQTLSTDDQTALEVSP